MPKKILVVDDEQDILETVRMRLEAYGYNVITAANGNDGYKKAKTESPDLIILDLMLPGLDGYQICRLLKFDEGYRRIPVIMLTAKSQEEDKMWSEKVGADCYLTKPFKSNELLQKVKELLGETGNG